MSTESTDLLQALIDTLRNEREQRANSLAHTVKSIRGTSLMVECLLLRENDSEAFDNLQAVHTHLLDLRLWLEEQLKHETDKSQIGMEVKNKTIH
jgi:hypothetical protein